MKQGYIAFCTNQILMIIAVILLVVNPIRAVNEQKFAGAVCSNSSGKFTQNSRYHNNLKQLLVKFTGETPVSSFRNSSLGGDVYGLFLCRGDVDLIECRLCLQAAADKVLQECPNQREAIIWFRKCMLRYAARPLFGQMEEDPWISDYGDGNVTNVDELNRFLSQTMDDLIDHAASPDNSKAFAKGKADIPLLGKLYCLVQCTPDVSNGSCAQCLKSAYADIDVCCGRGWKRIMIFRPSCQLRYSNYPFYPPYEQDAPPPQMPDAQPPHIKSQGKGLSRTTIIVTSAVATILISVLLVCGIVGFFCKRKMKKEIPTAPTEPTATISASTDPMESNECLQIDFSNIAAATENFSVSNKLGQGGFGAVYKGILEDGRAIAVKRLSMDSGQGEEEFKTEVLIVAKLQHKNLVQLLGYCIEGDERLLVYEFLPNLSLDRFLFGPNLQLSLEWKIRYKIIEGVAWGLLYLHRDSRMKIIHRDLKSSNILLDEQMNPKIADFGLAKLIANHQTHANTMKVAGTFGYMAPEYVMAGSYSERSDVYSFGIILLEIVTGQKFHGFSQASGISSIVHHAWKLWHEGKIAELIDASLAENISGSEALACIQIGLLCVQEVAAYRPEMATVVKMLNSKSDPLPSPSANAFPSYDSGLVTSEYTS